MGVDMSAEAVNQRLKILEQLWELSVSLMAAKREQNETASLSERSLAETWNTPEEGRGWRHLDELPEK